MRQIKISELKDGENYLVFVGYDWSPTGYDIATYDYSELNSQTNGEDLLLKKDIIIYELPVN